MSTNILSKFLFLCFCTFYACVFVKGQYVKESNMIIPYFNVEDFAFQYMNQPTLISKKAKWNYGNEYRYKLPNATGVITLTVGIHKSNSLAHIALQEYLQSISIKMTEIESKNFPCDLLFIWPNISDSVSISNVSILKDNIIIHLSKTKEGELLKLAKKLCQELELNKKHLQKKEESFPCVKKVESTINNGKKKFVVYSDKDYSNIEYQFYPNIFKKYEGINNSFVIDSSILQRYDNISKIKVVIITSDNKVSEVTEFEF